MDTTDPDEQQEYRSQFRAHLDDLHNEAIAQEPDASSLPLLHYGTRIYYTGDMANAEGKGTVSSMVDDPQWGRSYDLIMDDGRLFSGVRPASFVPGPGRRFLTLAEYEENRAAKIADMQRRYAELLARQ